MTDTYDIDGKFAQGWGGEAPNGVHVNVLLARRGSPTAASITTAFTSPSPGFTPILASLGPDQASYVTLNPPTVILNKSKPDTAFQETLIFGASQVGIAQGILDTVAEGLITQDQDTIALVSLWVDPAAADETQVRRNAREATAKASREAVIGRSEHEHLDLLEHRETLTHPFYGGR
ncbi:formaldehyde-activating enzyme [Pseudarthrobacter sp. SSS035]|uniref:formaldehyde-activating enzyme n=1 Tax=Pseudarthrobacter sp. SSS035 TaxID=2931399 RepID=UPI00200EB310|nr:formaldehyde-activating enzyme [Pseudarthrobacter sp. SSS035]